MFFLTEADELPLRKGVIVRQQVYYLQYPWEKSKVWLWSSRCAIYRSPWAKVRFWGSRCAIFPLRKSKSATPKWKTIEVKWSKLYWELPNKVLRDGFIFDRGWWIAPLQKCDCEAAGVLFTVPLEQNQKCDCEAESVYAICCIPWAKSKVWLWGSRCAIYSTPRAKSKV